MVCVQSDLPCSTQKKPELQLLVIWVPSAEPLLVAQMVPEYRCPRHTLLLVKNDIPDLVMDEGGVNSWLQLFHAKEKWGKKKPRAFSCKFDTSCSLSRVLYKDYSLWTSIMCKLRVIFWNFCYFDTNSGGWRKGKSHVWKCSMPHGLSCLLMSENILPI